MKKQLIKHTMVVAILFIASCKTEQNVQGANCRPGREYL
jgi:hypothetical protein